MLITCHEIESGVGEARAYELLWRAMWVASLPEILQFACPESSKRNEGTGAAIRIRKFQMPLKNAKIWQRKAGRRQGQNAVSNDDDVWNYHCHYYGSCVSFVTVSNCFSK